MRGFVEDWEDDSMVLECDMVERMEVSLAQSSGPQVITWDNMRMELEKDVIYSKLVAALENTDMWPKEAEAFAKYREELLVTDGMVIFRRRCVVPKALRHRTLECLHSGHQGVSSM